MQPSSGKIEKKCRETERISLKVVKKTPENTIEKSLHYSNVEGAFSSAASSITSSYTTPYALSLNATNTEIGLLNSLQNLASTVAQLPGAKISVWLNGRKRVWFLSTGLQRIFWIPIILLPFIPSSNPMLLLFIFLTLISFFSALRGPAWSSLMGDLVQRSRWGKYFGWRNTVTAVAGLIAILVSGQILIWFGFPILFTVALVLGLASIFFFSKMYEPPFRKEYHYTHSISMKPSTWATSIKINRNFASFTLFMVFMSFAVNIAAPFFAVYQLVNLHLSYAWYAALIVIESLVIILSQPYWGRLCDKMGDRKIMTVTGILICFVPFAYLFISNPYEIIPAAILSGFGWAGFGIATFNFMLAASPADKRAEFTANYSFFTGLAVVVGAIAGGLMAAVFRDNTILWFAGLQVVFLVSFLLRLASLALLPMCMECRVKEDKEPVSEIFWRVVAVRPVRGITHAIVHPDFEDWLEGFYGFFRAVKNKIVYRIRLWRTR
ncbi:MAG: MFS transporter [Candidatus Aenigmarchaeota archaeon]|nr:MFS transporter [Candidatus Aenigmarchaeota archaeon]